MAKNVQKPPERSVRVPVCQLESNATLTSAVLPGEQWCAGGDNCAALPRSAPVSTVAPHHPPSYSQTAGPSARLSLNSLGWKHIRPNTAANAASNLAVWLPGSPGRLHPTFISLFCSHVRRRVTGVYPYGGSCRWGWEEGCYKWNERWFHLTSSACGVLVRER